MSAQVRDMTKGSPAKLILLFAVPLMLGNIFQQLYTMVDTIVVGQVAGVQALAALGAVEWIMWMTLGVSTGVTQGFSILISQHYGAKKWNDLKKTVAHSYLLTAVTAILLLLISQLAARWLLVLLNTPDNIIGMSLIYLRIVFCGSPFTRRRPPPFHADVIACRTERSTACTVVPYMAATLGYTYFVTPTCAAGSSSSSITASRR